MPEEVHRAIRIRVEHNGYTFQAEMCDILATTVKPEGRVKLGDLLAGIVRKVKLTDDETAAFDRDHWFYFNVSNHSAYGVFFTNFRL